MKICLVNKFHTVKGGSETYYFGLGELLQKQGHKVIYFSMKDEKNRPCDQQKYFVENVDFNAKMGKLQTAKTALKSCSETRNRILFILIYFKANLPALL